MNFREVTKLILSLALLASCGGGGGSSSTQEEEVGSLSVNTRWYIQLQGVLREDVDVDLYDVDLFDTPAETIERLKSSGKIVICYFNAGAYENWREDADLFPEEVLGNPLEGWEGERWLDVRDQRVRDIMKRRLDLALQKGCDGVDPDNVDGFLNDTGFSITYEDQKNYNLFLSQEAHRRGLLIGLKNDGQQVRDLLPYFDFSVQEECHQYNECHLYYPFIEAGKPVFNIEYGEAYVNDEDAFRNLCETAEREGFMTAVYNLDLDGTLFRPCWNY